MAVISLGTTARRPLRQKETEVYLQSGEGCPWPECMGHPEEVYFTDMLEVQGDGTALISKKCGACGRTWVETYRLVSLEEEEEEDDLATVLWNVFHKEELDHGK